MAKPTLYGDSTSIRRRGMVRIMWYVMQTKVGDEKKLLDEISRIVDDSTYNSCFVISMESMRRRNGVQHMYEELLFNGYVMVDTYTPTAFYEELKKTTKYARLLSEDKKMDDESFIPVSVEEEMYLSGIMDEHHIVRLSYVTRNKNNRVNIVTGPLLVYQENISHIDFQHRRAYVEMRMFGRDVRLKFGLCTRQDLLDNNLEDRLSDIDLKIKDIQRESYDKWDWKKRKLIEKLQNEESDIYNIKELDGISIGSNVKIKSGIYGDTTFAVKAININKRTVKVSMVMFGSEVDVEVGVDEVEIENT